MLLCVHERRPGTYVGGGHNYVTVERAAPVCVCVDVCVCICSMMTTVQWP